MRVDVYLSQHGYVASRTRAQQLIAKGLITMDGRVLVRPSEDVDESISHAVEIVEDMVYVGRGGCKLEGALDAFSLDVQGAWALDIGASTGGFTDCLLRRGAQRVYAIDSGVGQLAPVLLSDARVVNMEKCNARYFSADALDGEFAQRGGADIIVMDVSFISQCCILPVFPALLREGGVAVTLIKPQFEVGRAGVGKGGIVKDAAWRRTAVERVLDFAATVGLYPVGLIRSPIEGGDGNVEYLAQLRRALPTEDASAAARELLLSLPREIYKS